MTRKEWEAWRTRIVVGSKLLCVENQYRPVCNGQVRTVTRVMKGSIRQTIDSESSKVDNFWTTWPTRVTGVQQIDADTVRYPLFEDQPHALTLRILAEAR